MICPDCNAEVVEVTTRDSISFAELAPDGPWVISDYEWDDNPPMALIAKKLPRHDGPRYRRHPCARRAEIREDLDTLHRVYGDRKSAPSISVPLSKIEGEVNPGDVITLTDGRWRGHSVRAEVKRVEFVAVPRWETYRPRDADRAESAMKGIRCEEAHPS